jgi:hypothetical protein
MERIARREPRRAPSRTMVRQCAGGEAARPKPSFDIKYRLKYRLWFVLQRFLRVKIGII